MDVSYGQVTFALNTALNNLDWPSLAWDGATATMWTGTMGDPWSAYRQVWNGTVGPIQRDSDQVASVALLGPEASLSRNLLTATYQGIGGAEGPASLLGTYKPWAAGACVNVEAVLIDPVYWVYQVDAYDACAVSAVYENALILDPAKRVGDYASYSALRAATVKVGEWATCTAQGLYRLGAEPSGKITADIGTATTTGALIASLMGMAGIIPAKIDSSVTNAGGAACLYAKDQVTIGEAARKAAADAGMYLVTDAQGIWHLAAHVSAKAPIALTSDRSTYPLVRPDTIKQEVVASPAWRVSVGHTRVWSTHSTSEISPAVADLAANQLALDAKAQDAQDAADQAQADATAALARLTSISSDNVLDRSDKATTIKELQTILAERSGIVSQATGLGIISERDAYNTAIQSLQTYLDGLVPSYTDMTRDTPIDGAEYRAKFVAVYGARQTLLNKIAGIGNLSAYLTNDAHVLAADTAGNVLTYDGAGGRYVVMDGPNIITSGVTYAIVSTLNVTATIAADGAYAVTAMSASSGSVVLRASYDGQTFDRIFSLAKAVQGPPGSAGPPGADGHQGVDGAPGVTGYLTAEVVSVWAYANGGVTDYAPAQTWFRITSGASDLTSSFAFALDDNPNNLAVMIAGNHISVTGGFDSANLDVASVRIRATGSGAYSGVVITKTFSLAKSKGGYEIVTSLPTSNLFVGRMVYLVSNNKLYRYAGSAWTAAVAAGDLSGTIVGTQISDNAVSSPKLAANAVTADKIEAGAVTAAKINVTDLSSITAKIGTLRTATTGARTEITNDGLRVYDGNNILRVRIGLW